ncbi:hypothetical protein Hamer_G013136 [Homarus americanus]|uniref:Uncharacterized protein n=1 Tax=Homarus americanus TaxID=6706 RepID=A0A8J5JW62_HOMAM|nr:hypothetical protein Hamer_G013136 [Homarus americanus]
MPSENSKRTSVESLRRPSIESLKSASLESGRRSSIEKQDSASGQTDKSEKGELPDSYIQSKFSRKGSRQYRNAGWKSPQNILSRNNSSSSVKSNISDKVQVENSKQEPQEVVAQMSPSERQAYVQQKFVDITNILQAAGIAEDILQEIKNQY